MGLSIYVVDCPGGNNRYFITEVKNCMNACCNPLSEYGCPTTQCKCFNPCILLVYRLLLKFSLAMCQSVTIIIIIYSYYYLLLLLIF